MKRILLTTTSLVLAAGVAQADVSFYTNSNEKIRNRERIRGTQTTH